MSIRLKNPITRRVLRYFGVVDTKASAEPVSRTDDPESALVKHEHTFPPETYTFQTYPDDPLVYYVKADGWASWSFMQRETFRRGWSFARYAVKSPEPGSRMASVFGIVRGPWGICKMDFYICGPGTYDTLNAITHLPSGMGCGLFTDQDSAAAACDIAARLKDDWETLDPYADARVTGEALHRMHGAWAAAGLTQCATHAHTTADRETQPLPIWFQDYSTVVAGRPEGKLS